MKEEIHFTQNTWRYFPISNIISPSCKLKTKDYPVINKKKYVKSLIIFSISKSK